jgi:hypothetical protein
MFIKQIQATEKRKNGACLNRHCYSLKKCKKSKMCDGGEALIDKDLTELKTI